MPNLRVSGVDCHIGSQLTELAPFIAALDRVLALVAAVEAEGIEIRHLDLGGGLGVRYTQERPPEPEAYAAALERRLGAASYEIIIEPGRAIAANAGILLSRVEYLKPTPHKDFAVIDAAMNDLLRPALYHAVQEIVPVRLATGGRPSRYDVVGPVCESGDFLGQERELILQAGDLLAVRSSGAYGFSMSSNYNSRPRPAEIMVDGAHAYAVRRRETVAELFATESLIP